MLNFLGIGAQKAGTTWIAQNLEKHPQISFPHGKEIHFWDEHYSRGVNWYKDIFAGNNALISGEITPAYAFMSLEKIQELYNLYPDIRLIYCVRNPIARAWSAARMMLRRAEMDISEASDQWFVDHFNSRGSKLRGDYILALNNWLSVFSAEQLLLLDFNDIIKRPNAMLMDIAGHIGVDKEFFSKEMDNVIYQPIHSSGKKEVVRPSLMPELEALYADKVHEMAHHPILKKIIF